MRHWKTEINFEAWDEEDAVRMVRRMIEPVEVESRLIFATNVEETTEYRRDPATQTDVTIYGAGSS